MLLALSSIAVVTSLTRLSFAAQGPEHLPAYKPGGRLETFDIEELVAEGKAGYAFATCLA